MFFCAVCSDLEQPVSGVASSVRFYCSPAIALLDAFVLFVRFKQASHWVGSDSDFCKKLLDYLDLTMSTYNIFRPDTGVCSDWIYI
jgi:hypothetical protein